MSSRRTLRWLSVSALATTMLSLYPVRAQTAQIPPLVIPLPAVVQPQQTLKGSVTGKTCTVVLPQRTLLPASQTMTTATSAQINLSGTNLDFTMQLTPAQVTALRIALAQGGSVSGITITLSKGTP